MRIDNQPANVALPEPKAICLASEAWLAAKLSVRDKARGQANRK